MPDQDAVNGFAQSLLDIQPFVVTKNSVVLRDVTKGYRVRTTVFPVLKNLTMTVPQGTIYGLLGPSGCGKTTLLKCIVGRLSVKHGTISVFGVPPGAYVQESNSSKPKIGYMPQDFALNEELTVNETLKLYGRITGMSSKEISERSKFLINFLNMTYCCKCIGKLSGGQKRRVSFAVALLHQPELLILDEPTVGVDPVLRQSIWDYLYTLVNNTNATVIITTHYIEEARMAHNVGLMLNGTMLAESPPERLIQRHNCTTLEEVFLKLCLIRTDISEDPDENENENETSKSNLKQLVVCEDHVKAEGKPLTNGIDDHVLIEMTSKPNGDEVSHPTTPSPLGNGKIDSVHNHVNQDKDVHTSLVTPQVHLEMRPYKKKFLEMPVFSRIYALFLKSMLFFVRHPGSVILEFFLPAAIMVIFSLAVGKPLFGLPIGIVNEDSLDMGGNYLKYINPETILQVSYDSYEEAYKDAKNGVTWGVIYINHNFTDAIISRFTHAGLADNDTLEQGTIGVALDASNQQISLVIHGELLIAFQRFAQNVLTRIGVNPLIGTVPFKFEAEKIYGSSEMSFNQFLLPAFVLCVTFFMAMGLTALTLIIERQSGCIERLMVTGVGSIDLILSQLMAQLLVMLVQIFLMLLVVFAIFNFYCEGSYLLASLLAVWQGLCGMSLGMVISSICDEQTTAIVLSLAVFFVSIMMDGILWPLEGMPYLLRYVSGAMPQTYAVEAMRCIVNRGWGLTYIPVIAGFCITIGWTILFIVLAWVISRYIH